MHKLSLSHKIGDVADKEFVTLIENTSVGVAAKVMRDKDNTWFKNHEYKLS